MSKLLITPVVTPLGLPSEKELEQVWPDGVVMIPTGEWQKIPQRLREGAPEHFHTACQKLLESLKGNTDAILVGGTTGEGVWFWIRQYRALLSAMKKACPPDIRIMAGLLGRDDMVRGQVLAAQVLWISEFVLGLNHTGDNQRRFDYSMSVSGSKDRWYIYNLPTFPTASLKFIERCGEDMRVLWIKDSSAGTDEMRLRHLLNLKSQRRDFQVLAGNEGVYGDLRDPEFDEIDGLVSGNSNADPDLLRQFTDNPHNWTSQARKELHDAIARLPLGRRPHTPTEHIENHILGLKIRLLELWIFEPQHVWLYSPGRGTLFQTYTQN